MGRKIVLDNCVLAWAYASVDAEDYADEKILQAKRLIEKLDKDGDEILLPTIILFEFLSIFSEHEFEQREKLIQTLSKHIKLIEFGHECAVKSSELFRISRHPSVRTEIDETNRTSSQRKSDIMILGQSHANGVDCIYTGDDRFITIYTRLSQHCDVKVAPMPESEEWTIEDRGVVIPNSSSGNTVL